MIAHSVLITGASSGIGRALALAWSGPDVALALGGRDERRLEAVASACRDCGAKVSLRVVDVRDAAAIRDWISEADAAAPLDLVIANAGMGAGLAERCDSLAATREIIEVNLTGTLNTIEPAIERMRPRRSGHLVLMGSLAALRGIPGAHGYSASKAAIKALAEGLRPQLAAEGIGISLIMPGFVRTPMNEGRGFPTPLRIEPERAAAIIRRSVERGRFQIVFPVALLWGSRLLGLAPGLADALAVRAARQG